MPPKPKDAPVAWQVLKKYKDDVLDPEIATLNKKVAEATKLTQKCDAAKVRVAMPSYVALSPVRPPSPPSRQTRPAAERPHRAAFTENNPGQA